MKLFVPSETSALSLGAEAVARAIVDQAGRRGVDVTLVRPGSRGACWLEPLVEVETEGGRMAYGPVGLSDIEGLFEADFTHGGDHTLKLGDPNEIDWFKRQTRACYSRCGVIDPLSLEEFEGHGGFAGLKRALEMSPEEIVDAVEVSGLRGRGGAGFPAGIKWRTVLAQDSGEKFVVCNADEGDSGTFSDRMLMEGDPFCLIEGILIAGLATGASAGYIYLRSEYPLAKKILVRALELARAAGWLGANIQGSEFCFDITLRIGAGSYVCGEETALIESLEGKRGQVRAKPPLPAISGLFDQPTLVNNVITLASVPGILRDGGEAYGSLGCGRSKGTLPVQLGGNIARGGVVEMPFGITLRELIYDFGGGTATGRPVRAVQVGGPLGAYLPESALDVQLDYEALIAVGGLVGHGGIVVFDDTVDMLAQARFAMEFCALESCGKCTPCRIGSVRGVEVIDHIADGGDVSGKMAMLEDLMEAMEDGSLCAMGGLTPLPVRSALKHFPEDFETFGVPHRHLASGGTTWA